MGVGFPFLSYSGEVGGDKYRKDLTIVPDLRVSETTRPKPPGQSGVNPSYTLYSESGGLRRSESGSGTGETRGYPIFTPREIG